VPDTIPPRSVHLQCGKHRNVDFMRTFRKSPSHLKLRHGRGPRVNAVVRLLEPSHNLSIGNAASWSGSKHITRRPPVPDTRTPSRFGETKNGTQNVLSASRGVFGSCSRASVYQICQIAAIPVVGPHKLLPAHGSQQLGTLPSTRARDQSTSQLLPAGGISEKVVAKNHP